MLKLFVKKIKPTVSLKKGLSLVYGIGESTANRICFTAGINPNEKVGNLSERAHGKIHFYLKSNGINPSSIKKARRDAVLELISKRSYRGMRHKSKYPVRGQRTSTNARTQKRIGSKHAKI
jgi:small subunit ribosomal protein S13